MNSAEEARQRMIERNRNLWRTDAEGAPSAAHNDAAAGGNSVEAARVRMVQRHKDAWKQPLGGLPVTTSRAMVRGDEAVSVVRPQRERVPSTPENVKARMDLEDIARPVLPSSTPLGRLSNREIREAVILTKQPSARAQLEGQSDAYINARFDAVMGIKTATTTRADSTARGLSGGRVARYDVNKIHLEEDR